MIKLSPEWTRVRLGDHLDFLTSGSRGWAKYYNDQGSSIFIRIGNVGKNYLNLDRDVQRIDAPSDSEARRTKVRPGDVILSITADLGRTAVIPDCICDAFINQHLAIIRPRGFFPSFLSHFLASPGGQRQLMRLDRGGVKSGLNFDDISSLVVPLPPFHEQRRIAAILDKADAIRRKRQQALALADDFLRSAFLGMFGSPVPNPQGWGLSPIGECVTAVDAGWSAKGLDRPATLDEVGVLKVSAVTSGRYRPSENKAVESVDAARKLVVPARGDFLFSRANTRELVAATCIVDRTVENVFLPDKLWRIRLDERRIIPQYLKFVLSDPIFRSALCAKATGTSGSMLNISQGKLLETPLPLPPIDRQRAFAALVQKTEAVRAQSAEARSADEVLFASLSQRAFRGDLLPDSVPA